MSKQDLGFVEGPSAPSAVPSAPTAPPSYDEAMQQAAAAYMPMPGSHTMPQPMPMEPVMHMPHPPPGYVPPNQVPVPQQAPVIYPLSAPAPAPSTIIITNVPLGRDRCYMNCPKCCARVLTETTEKNHRMAHIWCCLLMCLGCPCCSCLPYCMDSCKVVRHKCPNCKAKLGSFRPYWATLWAAQGGDVLHIVFFLAKCISNGFWHRAQNFALLCYI